MPFLRIVLPQPSAMNWRYIGLTIIMIIIYLQQMPIYNFFIDITMFDWMPLRIR